MDLAPVQQLLEVFGIPTLLGMVGTYIQAATRHRNAEAAAREQDNKARQAHHESIDRAIELLTERVTGIDDWRVKHEQANRKSFRRLHRRLDQHQERDTRYLTRRRA